MWLSGSQEKCIEKKKGDQSTNQNEKMEHEQEEQSEFEADIWDTMHVLFHFHFINDSR